MEQSALGKVVLQFTAHVAKHLPTADLADWLSRSNGWSETSNNPLLVVNTSILLITFVMKDVLELENVRLYHVQNSLIHSRAPRSRHAAFPPTRALPISTKTNVTRNSARYLAATKLFTSGPTASKRKTCSTPLILYQHSDMIRLYCTSYRHISPALLLPFMLTCSMPSHLPNTGKSKTESVIRNILKSTTSFVCLREMGNLCY